MTLLAAWVFAGTANAGVPQRILFPVVAKTHYTDDFGARRGSRSHQGNDIMAARWSSVVAVERGEIEKPTWASTECMLILHAASGTDYWYLHLNNDRTTANDNRGGCRNGVSYAAGLTNGQRVRAGQLIGYVGNSGNANWGDPHLHFELHPAGGAAVSPYPWLQRARRALFARSSDIATPLTLRLNGTARRADASSFSIAVRRVRMSTTGWISKPARNVTLAVTPHTVVYRTRADGWKRTTLATLVPGERVLTRTTYFQPTLTTQIARANVLTTRTIVLRGTS